MPSNHGKVELLDLGKGGSFLLRKVSLAHMYAGKLISP